MKIKENKVTNIEEDVVFNGKFKFEGLLTVKGRLNGEIEGKESKIVIEKEGEINGQLKAQIVDNYGNLVGKATMDEYNLFNHGTSDAEIQVKNIMIEKGAVFNGTCKMVKKKQNDG